MAEEPKVVTLMTLMNHAPSHDGCKCGWRGSNLMDHVEAELRRDVEAKGLTMRDDGEST